ncbi:MAG: sensor histidine kinase [Bdellovibrionales bacterium]
MNSSIQSKNQQSKPTSNSAIESRAEIQHRILFFGVQASLRESLLASKKWLVDLTDDLSEVRNKLSSEKYDLLVFDSQLFDKIYSLDRFLMDYKSLQKIVLARPKDIEKFKQWQEEYSIQRFVVSPIDFLQLGEAILQVLTRVRLKDGQRDFLREIDFKNRELEQLTDGLEISVQQRTQSAKDSKQEAELKQKKARNLIYFIKDLGRAESNEEIFLLLQKDLRQHLGIKDLIMGLRGLDGSSQLYYIQGQTIHHLTPQKSWPLIKSIQPHSSEIQKYLAEELGRPVASVLYMPFLLTPSQPASLPFLALEHGFKNEQVHELMEFVTERFQAVAIAVDRVAMTLSLRDSALQWEKTFDALHEPVNIVDTSYQLLRSNSFFSEELSDGACYKIFQNQNRPCFGCPMEEAMKTGESKIGEIRRGERIFRVNSYPIKIPGSLYTNTVVNHYLDVTEDKKLYSRMIQSEKMAALGIMAGHIAHELNNPLTGLRSLSQILQTEIKENQNLVSDLSEIEKAAVRCQIIIKNLLDFSSLGDSFEEKEASLNQLVQHTIPMIKTALRIHRFDMDLTENEKPIFVNAHLLQQVIFNLVNNACQAMKDSGELSISTRLDQDFMELYVSDTGTGIPEPIRERIFDPFFTTKPEGVGTGLGLSMSRSVVESFEGTLTLVKSDLTGSTFLVRLPVKL